MTSHHLSIAGVSVASGVSEEELNEIRSLHSTLTEVRGVGSKTSAKILAEYTTREDLMNANPEQISSVDGVGEATADRILDRLSQGTWEATLSIKIESDPEKGKPYTVQVGTYRTATGSRLIPTLVKAVERIPEQKLIDYLRE